MSVPTEKVLLLAYMAAVFVQNLFVYMIAEYYRRMVDRRLNHIGFIISMCAISVGIGAITVSDARTFTGDEEVFIKIITSSMLTAAIASLYNGIELYFFTRPEANRKRGSAVGQSGE